MNSNVIAKYSEETIYIISYARLPENIPAALLHGHVGVGMIVNYQTNIIEDISCTLITEEARVFLKSIINGYDLSENGIEPLVCDIKKRFHGASQKSICVTLRDNYNKYIKWKSEN